MDKRDALLNLQGCSWLIIIISALALISKVIYLDPVNPIFEVIVEFLFWGGMFVIGWVIQLSRRTLAKLK